MILGIVSFSISFIAFIFWAEMKGFIRSRIQAGFSPLGGFLIAAGLLAAILGIADSTISQKGNQKTGVNPAAVTGIITGVLCIIISLFFFFFSKKQNGAEYIREPEACF